MDSSTLNFHAWEQPVHHSTRQSTPPECNSLKKSFLGIEKLNIAWAAPVIDRGVQHALSSQHASWGCKNQRFLGNTPFPKAQGGRRCAAGIRGTTIQPISEGTFGKKEKDLSQKKKKKEIMKSLTLRGTKNWGN